jgi:transposase
MWTKLSEDEIRLAKSWYLDDVKPRDIATRLGRNKCTITRLLCQKKTRKTQGRKPALTEAAVDKLEAKLNQLVQKADAKYEVTVDMLKKSCRSKVSTRTISNALHKRKIYFRPLRSKPVLTEDDVQARKEFAKTHGGHTEAWWSKQLHMIIDVKYYKVYLNSKARGFAAREATRGAYRKLGQGLQKPYVKPGKHLKYNPGAKSVAVLAGVGDGKVMMWEYVKTGWSGETAAEMYRGPIKRALQSHHPGKRKFRVLEDNDPTGFKSGKGMAAKEEVGIQSFEIPKRSPVLNVCDYFLWHEVNRRMRAQEKKWPANRKETREEYLRRLQKTAMSIPAPLLQKATGDMKRRCQRLAEAEGRDIEEGGKRVH